MKITVGVHYRCLLDLFGTCFWLHNAWCLCVFPVPLFSLSFFSFFLTSPQTKKAHKTEAVVLSTSTELWEGERCLEIFTWMRFSEMRGFSRLLRHISWTSDHCCFSCNLFYVEETTTSLVNITILMSSIEEWNCSGSEFWHCSSKWKILFVIMAKESKYALGNTRLFALCVVTRWG